MTGDLLTDLAISLGGIAFLVGFSIALGAMKRRPLSLAAAKERLGFDEPDFVATDWLLDPKQSAALAASDTDEMALVFRMGDNFATRRFALSQAKIDREGEGLVLAIEGLSSRLRLDAGSEEMAALWVGRAA